MEIQRSSAAACTCSSLVEIMRTSTASLVAADIASASGTVASARPVRAIGGVDLAGARRVVKEEEGEGEIGRSRRERICNHLCVMYRWLATAERNYRNKS
ncbi:hypothetical protein ZWY2020_038760 [Hordeum vulgare]|nr:hypothetical protein ZWY2020_038760 [Hordeum vulgare]